MNAINHMGFIVASYGAAVGVIGALIAWVSVDYHTQRLRLAIWKCAESPAVPRRHNLRPRSNKRRKKRDQRAE